MKKQSENTVVTNSNQNTENLTAVVNHKTETGQTKMFTVAELWNIRSKTITMFDRRNCA